MPDRLGDKVRLLHILDAITEIENYIQDADSIAHCRFGSAITSSGFGCRFGSTRLVRRFWFRPIWQYTR